MKRTEPKTITVGNGEEIKIRTDGSVEARDCEGRLLGRVPGRVLDQIVASSDKSSGNGDEPALNNEDTTYTLDTEDDPPTLTVQLDEMVLEVKDIRALLKQQRGPKVMLGVEVDRRALMKILDMMDIEPRKLKLGEREYSIDYENGDVSFNSGDRIYSVDALKSIQKISQLMRNGKSTRKGTPAVRPKA